jgi:outer membrane protein assembly factor BamB
MIDSMNQGRGDRKMQRQSRRTGWNWASLPLAGWAAITGLGTLHAADDWLQFRSSSGNSAAPQATLPDDFGGDEKKHVLLQIPIAGRAVSGPIIVGDQVITTSSGGVDQRRLYLTSVSRTDGRVLWQQQWVARGRPFCHPTSANAAPTPASDGQHVFAFFSSNDCAAFDLEGRLVWVRSLATDFPKAGNDVGMSSSPWVVDGVLVLQIECQGDSFAIGLDAKTGKTLWRVDRPRQANWASPTSVQTEDGKTLILLQSSKSLIGLDPKTGVTKFELDVPCSGIPSTVAVGQTLFVPSGGLTAIRIGRSDQTPEILWKNNKLGSNSASPILHEGKVYCVNRSVLVCGDAQTGELKWQVRLPDAGSIWATPVVVDKRLIAFAEDGKAFVVDLSGDEGKLIQTNTLGESVLGSPAVAGNQMWVRSVNQLWKIGDPD